MNFIQPTAKNKKPVDYLPTGIRLTGESLSFSRSISEVEQAFEEITSRAANDQAYSTIKR